MDRIDKENYYLDIAQTVQERSTCLRKRYGAIIVRNDEIVSTRIQRSTARPEQLFRSGILPAGEDEDSQRRTL